MKQLDNGVVDIMCVCETKLKRSHIPEVERLKRRYPSVVLRMCQGATEARRGVITMWRTDMPFYLVSSRDDGDASRCLSLRFKAAGGHKLTLACGYLENARAPATERARFFDHLGSHVPPRHEHHMPSYAWGTSTW